MVVQQGIVGDKGRILEGFHYRMPPVFDLDAALHIDKGTGILPPHRHLGKGTEHVELRNRPGRPLNAVELLGNRGTHLGEELIFEGHHPVLGSQDPGLQLLELLRDVPFGVGEGLLAYVVLRHLAGVSAGDFDIIPEHPVVADLQVLDAGALFLLGLHPGDDALAVGHFETELVDLGVVSRLDHAAFPDGKGRILHDGAVDEGIDVLQGIDPVPDLPEEGRPYLRQLFLDRLHLPDGLTKGAQLLGVGAAVDDPGHDPLEIIDIRQLPSKIPPQDGVVHQLIHRILTAADLGGAEQGLFDPGADQPLAHGGFGPVQHPQQRAALFLVPHGFEQLEIPPGGQVELHELHVRIHVEVSQAFQSRHLGRVEVLQRAAQRPHGRKLLPQPELLQGGLAEMGQDPLLRLIVIEVLGLRHLDRGGQPLGDEMGNQLLPRGHVVIQDLARGETAELVGHPQGHLFPG